MPTRMARVMAGLLYILTPFRHRPLKFGVRCVRAFLLRVYEAKLKNRELFNGNS